MKKCKNRYTSKQICEAIKYWKSQLRRMDEEKQPLDVNVDEESFSSVHLSLSQVVDELKKSSNSKLNNTYYSRFKKILDDFDAEADKFEAEFDVASTLGS